MPLGMIPACQVPSTRSLGPRGKEFLESCGTNQTFSYVLKVSVTSLIFSFTLRSDTHSNLTCSSVSKIVMTPTTNRISSTLIIVHCSSPSSPILKLKVLYGSDPPCPWRGGAPGLKKLVKLEPTFHTSTMHSSNDKVTRRRPSGEKLHAVVRFL